MTRILPYIYSNIAFISVKDSKKGHKIVKEWIKLRYFNIQLYYTIASF